MLSLKGSLESQSCASQNGALNTLDDTMSDCWKPQNYQDTQIFSREIKQFKVTLERLHFKKH